VPEPAQLERRTTELLQRLIRFNTVNPPGDEEEAQHFLRDSLEGAGFQPGATRWRRPASSVTCSPPSTAART
jgi:hypothetical protein